MCIGYKKHIDEIVLMRKMGKSAELWLKMIKNRNIF